MIALVLTVIVPLAARSRRRKGNDTVIFTLVAMVGLLWEAREQRWPVQHDVKRNLQGLCRDATETSTNNAVIQLAQFGQTLHRCSISMGNHFCQQSVGLAFREDSQMDESYQQTEGAGDRNVHLQCYPGA